MNPNYTQLNIWQISRPLFEAIVEDAGLGATRVAVLHRLLVEECERRGIEVPKPPKNA